MTKRIIDGMSSQEIVDGIFSINDGYKIVKIGDYIHQICKPVPSWQDDASADNPILCWVSDSPLPKSDGKTYPGVPDYVTGLRERGYMSVNGSYWKHARPISPDDIGFTRRYGESEVRPPSITKDDMKLNELELLAEDLECVQMWLDDKKAPKINAEGKEYSVVGRMQCLLNSKKRRK